MSCPSRQRVHVSGCRLAFEPMEQRRMLAGDGFDDGRAVSFSSREGGAVSIDHFSTAGDSGSWTTGLLTVRSYDTWAAVRVSGLDSSSATLMDQGRSGAATRPSASQVLSGFGTLPRGALELMESTGGRGVVVRDLGTGLTTHMDLPLGSTAGVGVGPGSVGMAAKTMPPCDAIPAWAGEGGAVSVSQSLRRLHVDLATITGRTALGDRTELASGRSAASMVMGEMARGVVAPNVAWPDAALVAGGGSARLPAGSAPVVTTGLWGGAGASASGVVAVRRAVAVTPTVVARHEPPDVRASVGHGRVLRHTGGPTSSDEPAAVAERIGGPGSGGSQITAATAASDGDDVTWRRLLAAAPVVILVVVQKLVDDALTHDVRRPDRQAFGPADPRQPGCMPRLAERRPARRRTRPQTA